MTRTRSRKFRLRLKLRHPRLIALAAGAAAWAIRLWMATVRYRVVNHDAAPHPAEGDGDGTRFIYAFWHESLLAPVKFRVRAHVLISQHADGEFIARAAKRLGFDAVRGSSTRGGGGALMALWDCSRRTHLVFHPDGPRGPRRVAQRGAVAVASRTGLPVVPVGVGYSRAWRARSWDRFALPWPFSRCVFVAAEAVRVPPDLDRDGLEPYRLLVQERMLAATAEAERLAKGPATRPRNEPPAPHLAGRRAGSPADPQRP